MSRVEFLSTLGLLGLILAAALAFQAKRRPTSDYAETQRVKARLPGWVTTIEKLVTLVVFVVGIGLVLAGEAFLTRHAGLRQRADGAPAVFAGVGAFLAWLPLAFLLSNAISWLTPPMRRSNLNAMAGSPVSFTSLNAGLIKFALVTVPSGLVLMAVAALAPWSH